MYKSLSKLSPKFSIRAQTTLTRCVCETIDFCTKTKVVVDVFFGSSLFTIDVWIRSLIHSFVVYVCRNWSNQGLDMLLFRKFVCLVLASLLWCSSFLFLCSDFLQNSSLFLLCVEDFFSLSNSKCLLQCVITNQQSIHSLPNPLTFFLDSVPVFSTEWLDSPNFLCWVEVRISFILEYLLGCLRCLLLVNSFPFCWYIF